MPDSAPHFDDAYQLDDRYRREDGRIFLTGTQALVRLALMQHRLDFSRGLNTAGFISGYRGSPLGGFDQELWRQKKWLSGEHIHFEPGLNEDLAATAVWGTQQIGTYRPARYDGVFAFWYGKGNGVDRTGDAFRLANAHGTQSLGGVLAFAGDDHAAQSSIIPHQTDQIFEAVMMPILNPASITEYLELGLAGIAMSRFAGTWVAFKTITEIVESGRTIDLAGIRRSFVVPRDIVVPAHGFNIDPGLEWPAQRLELERRLQDERLPAAQAFARANGLDKVIYRGPRARLGLVTTGKSHQDVLEALGQLGIDRRAAEGLGLSIYKVALTWPLEPDGLSEFVEGLEEIFVIEEKRSLVERQVRELLYNRPANRRPCVVGKQDETGARLLSPNSELSPETLVEALASRLLRLGGDTASLVTLRLNEWRSRRRHAPLAAASLTRTPFFCSGCPHNTSTRLPLGSTAGGGTGCHLMVVGQGRNTETYTQMGGEGAQWLGEAPFSQVPHIFQNLGDGTFQHSGSLAIRQAVAAGSNITFKVLFNDAVAMTGGQAPEGQLTVEKVAKLTLAEGVAATIVVTDDPARYAEATLPPDVAVHHREELDAVQKELRETAGVTVLIYDQTCAAEKRRRRKRGLMEDPTRRLFINKRVCEGCGDCVEESNCISVEPVDTIYGRKRQINQSTCNKDYSCVNGFCPSFVSVEGGRLRRPAPKSLDGLDALVAALPTPAVYGEESSDICNILVAGIGGTGVVTIGALLSMAAHLDGKTATALDFTGLAQKNGAVISHLRIARRSEPIHAVRVPDGSTDLLIGCDLVVSASSDILKAVAGRRTHAVLNLEAVPTAALVKDSGQDFPAAALRQGLEKNLSDADFIDATALATKLFGDAIATNLLLLGFACQKGWLPVSLAALERAIELNGVAAEKNRQILGVGRLYAVHKAVIEKAAGLTSEPPEQPTLETLVASFARELEAYQNPKYAARFLRLIDTVRETERRLLPGTTALAEATARSYFKLLAIKDEYEVARLFTNGEFERSLSETFEGAPRLKFHMAPPILARPNLETGKVDKMTFGGWVMPVLRIIARFRSVRGRWFDPFAYTDERRFERELIANFEGLVAGILSSLTPANHGLAVEIAKIPMRIRGYGHIKKRSAEIQAQRQTELLGRFLAASDAVQNVSPEVRVTI